VRTPRILIIAISMLAALGTQSLASAQQGQRLILGQRTSGEPQPGTREKAGTNVAEFTYDFVFPITAVGQTTSQTCFYTCVQTPNAWCGSGTATVNLLTGATSPFKATNFRLIEAANDSCAGTPVTLPVEVPPGQLLAFDAAFSPQAPGQFTSTVTLSNEGFATSFIFQGSTVRAFCTASATTLCLSYGRFSVTATWATSTGQSGVANMIQITDDTGVMWFFDPSELEAEVKIVDGCGLGGHYWFFAGGLTNVEVTITVTDTSTGLRQVYTNPQGTAFAPIQDTSAFSSCP
jgi:hypothetical protein